MVVVVVLVVVAAVVVVVVVVVVVDELAINLETSPSTELGCIHSVSCRSVLGTA